MNLVIVIIALIIIYAIFLFVKHAQRRQKYPPGPFSLPFVGIKPILIIKFFFPKLFPAITEDEFYWKMKETYGDIWSIDMGDKRIVVLASIDVALEALVNKGKIFSGRPKHESLKIISADRGIAFIDGPIQIQNRKLALQALREFGLGQIEFQNLVSTEVDELIDEIAKDGSTLIDSPSIFIKPLIKIMSQMSFDTKNLLKDEKLEKFIDSMNIMTHSNDAHNIIELFSKVLSIDSLKRIFTPVRKLIMSTNECMAYMDKKCRNRIPIADEDSKPNCIFDFFWKNLDKTTTCINEDEKILNISHSLFDLVFAGTDTVATMLSYAFLLLGKEEDLQKELRKEIQDFADNHKSITMDMRKNCPKLLSFIDETMRFHPLNSRVLSRAKENCVLRGYQIESVDSIYCDIATIFRDGKLFDNPQCFNPYRFLDETKTKHIPHKAFIPFGMGKRVCIGESMAMTEIFLFLSKFLLKFCISLPNKTEENLDEIIKGTYGIVHAPLDHKIYLHANKLN